MARMGITERGRARALEDLMSETYAIQKHNDLHALTLDELSCVWTKQGSSFLFLAVLLVKLFSFVTRSSKMIGKPDVRFNKGVFYESQQRCAARLGDGNLQIITFSSAGQV